MEIEPDRNVSHRILLAAGFGVPALLICAIASGYQQFHDEPAPAVAPVVMAPIAPVARVTPAPSASTAEDAELADFHKIVQPILEEHCYDCHGNGESRNGVAFDKLTTDDQILHNPQLWFKVINMTRGHMMPPSGNVPPTPDQQLALEKWIKTAGFGVNPDNLDPGRVTVHRLNSFEYQNTIHDLMGVNFNTDAAFPGDDIGYGFDNIADVLNISPLLMEKYLAAAQTIVDQAVPTITKIPAAQDAGINDFLNDDGSKIPVMPDSKDPAFASTNPKIAEIGGSSLDHAVQLDYTMDGSVKHVFTIKEPGDYRIVVDQNIRGNFDFVAQQCTVTITADGKQLDQNQYVWKQNDDFTGSYALHLEPGEHIVAVTLAPVLPLVKPAQGKPDIFFNLTGMHVQGPMDPAKWVHPANYERFFTRDAPPTDPAERRVYAKEVLGNFAAKAYRRPVPADTVDQLVDIAEKIYTLPENTFEKGVAHAIVAVLASPRFLFRVESPAPASGQLAAFADVDEYSLASRLSYFLWASMPDDQLIKLAAAGQLRANLDTQVKRMVADPRSQAFIDNFSDQWLQTRAMTTVPLNPKEILARQGITGSPTMTDDLRAMFKQEAESYFGYVMHEDHSVDEFLDSNYTFLNETLAGYYGFEKTDPDTRMPVYSGLDPSVSDVTGPEMRKVTLAADHWYGGMLTMGSVLMVTSNPTRTSPVKRGKWLLENILGAPSPPPPPDIPALEQAAENMDHVPTLRETLAAHRASPVCASCHDRMDPLGLALENFSALGQLHDKDMGQPVDASGTLATGESFKDMRELKHILATNHKVEYYRCLTEKLMTYALGRGVEYYDVPTIDKIVAKLDVDNGRFSTLLLGVIESAPFQQQRTVPDILPDAAKSAPRLTQTTTAHEDAPVQ